MRSADDANLAVDDFKVVLGGFEHVARELARLGGDGLGRDMHRRAGGDGLTAGEAAKPKRRGRRIAGNDGDILRRARRNAAAQICASAVATPCPMAAAPVDTVMPPVGDTRTPPNSNGPRPVPLTPCAKPMPR